MIHFENFMKSLPISGMSYLGVFVVIAAVYVCVYLLCKAFKNKE